MPLLEDIESGKSKTVYNCYAMLMQSFYNYYAFMLLHIFIQLWL